jgi:hypothetical protein
LRLTSVRVTVAVRASRSTSAHFDPEVWDIVAQAFENKPEAANTFAQLLFDIKRAIADGSRNQLLFSMGFKTVPLPAIV